MEKVKVDFSNLVSQLFLKFVSEEQFTVPVPPPKRLEDFTIWYERNILNVDISNITIDRPYILNWVT